MTKADIKIGVKVCRLTISGEMFPKNRTTYVECICECGVIKSYSVSDLLRGHTKSCGCFSREQTSKRRLTHGESSNTANTKEYETWAKMISRCTNPKNNRYKHYGERGISVCEEWVNSYEVFLFDMGRAPSKEHSIDRINVNGNYCKENCRWATKIEQANNKTNNVKIELNGIVKNVGEWESLLGFKSGTISNRIKSGWTAEKAAFTPIRQHKEYDYQKK